MANISIPRDNNRVTVIAGTSSSDGATPVTIYVDPTTHRLKVDLAGNGNITIGASTITGGTNGRILYDNAGVIGEMTTTGNGTVVVLATSPTLVTPALGVATATSINGNTFTTGTYTLTGQAGKTLTFNGSITLTGTDAQTYTFPTTTATLARTDAGQTFTGVSNATSWNFTTPVLGTPTSGTLTNCTGLPAASIVAGTLGTGAYVMDTKLTVPQVITTANAITASANAATVPVTSRNNIVTNNSAATLTVTLTTAGAVNMQQCVLQILDFSAVAQTLTLVNTENSTVTVPITTNGSTTLPLTIGFIYNAATSKWRCVASS